MIKKKKLIIAVLVSMFAMNGVRGGDSNGMTELHSEPVRYMGFCKRCSKIPFRSAIDERVLYWSIVPSILAFEVSDIKKVFRYHDDTNFKYYGAQLIDGSILRITYMRTTGTKTYRSTKNTDMGNVYAASNRDQLAVLKGIYARQETEKNLR